MKIYHTRINTRSILNQTCSNSIFLKIKPYREIYYFILFTYFRFYDDPLLIVYSLLTRSVINYVQTYLVNFHIQFSRKLSRK